MDWEGLADKKVAAPFKPIQHNENILENVDNILLQESFLETPGKHKSEKNVDLQFEEFTYSAEKML